MAHAAKSRFWRKCRIYFRRFRITVLLVILALLGAVIYLNQTGLPGFVKRPLLAKLRARGVNLEFSRLRLRWYRGIVAEDVRFGQAKDPASPRLSAKEVEIELNEHALARFQLQVDALDLRQGRLEWSVGDTNAPDRTLTVQDIHTRLRLLPGDQWALDDFRARFAGARFILSGSVTNASAVRDWKFLHGKRPIRGAEWSERLRRLADTLDKISFATPPELRLMVDGDARDLPSFTARLTLHAPDADTPWGKATHVVFAARLFPGAGDEVSHAKLNLKAGTASTPWADAADLDLELHLGALAGQTNLVEADLIVRAAHAETKWASITNAQFTAHWIHSLTNAIPLSGRTELRVAAATTRWASAGNVRFTGNLGEATNPPPADPSWSWWTNLQPYLVDWECELTGLQSEKLVAERVLCAGQWRAPDLTVTNLHAELHGGAVEAAAALDVAARRASFDVASDFDVQKIAPLLAEKTRRWFGKYTWAEAPRLRGSGAVTLPAWTNREPDWRGEVLPTLRLAGEFAVTNGTYLGVAADWAHSHFSYTNMVWHLPDLEAGRPDGQIRLVHVADDSTSNYYFQVHSTIDPGALRPLLTTNQQRGFDYFKLTQPPVIDAELWGRWRQHDRIGFRGRVALTNFTFREQTADRFVTELRYTNRVLELAEPLLWRGTQVLSAAGIAADFNTMRIHFTNGFSTAEPLVVARAIGPQTARTLEPYHFSQPPTVRVSGYAPLKGASDADLRFAVDGGPFAWLKIKVPHITADVHWLGDTLVLTNVQSEFYWGDAAGHADIDFNRDQPGTDFRFAATVTNVHLPLLMADLATRTNHLEGWLSGQLVITNANSANSNSWQGYGQARLHDGLIWEIPVFGMLSKPLDAVVPGLGSSRVSEGSAQFIITNGVIFSDNLEMRAPALRLHYDGTVDFDGRVNARVDAELFRDTWLIGRVVSLVLWPVTKMFEYKITGTLKEPKTEPVYIPKLLLMPLHPFRTLEDWFSPDSGKTNAPPVFKEP